MPTQPSEAPRPKGRGILAKASEAARSRALRRGPGVWGFLLAHHGSGQLDRCYAIWMGARPVWFCARCIGLYPVLFGVVAIHLLWSVPTGWWDIPWLFLLPLPALLDWALDRLGVRKGRNRARTVTGMVLGLSLGRMVYLNMVEPGRLLVVAQLVLLTVLVMAVESAARLGEGRRRRVRDRLERVGGER